MTDVNPYTAPDRENIPEPSHVFPAVFGSLVGSALGVWFSWDIFVTKYKPGHTKPDWMVYTCLALIVFGAAVGASVAVSAYRRFRKGNIANSRRKHYGDAGHQDNAAEQ